MVWFTADRSSIPMKRMNEKIYIYVTKTAVKMSSHCSLFTVLDCIFSPFSHLRFFETDKSCVFFRLNAQCESFEAEKNHVFPAVHVDRRECFQQKEPLLFSCAGVSAKHQRLCHAETTSMAKVALCRDCLLSFHQRPPQMSVVN